MPLSAAFRPFEKVHTDIFSLTCISYLWLPKSALLRKSSTCLPLRVHRSLYRAEVWLQGQINEEGASKRSGGSWAL